MTFYYQCNLRATNKKSGDPWEEGPPPLSYGSPREEVQHPYFDGDDPREERVIARNMRPSREKL